MKIPAGFNQEQFYWAKRKENPKIKIKSEFLGVYFLKGKGSMLYWRAAWMGKRLGLFPFSISGENQAKICVETYLQNNNINPNDYNQRSINCRRNVPVLLVEKVGRK